MDELKQTKFFWLKRWLCLSGAVFSLFGCSVFLLKGSVFFILLGGFASGAEKSDALKLYGDSVLVYHSFDKPGGALLQDDSKNGHDARVSGNAFWSPDGVSGGAGHFQLGTKVLTESTRRLAKGAEFTIMMWVKPASLDGRMKIVSKRAYDSEFSYFMVSLDKGYPVGGVGMGEDVAATPKKNPLTPETWHHLALTLDSVKQLILYVDGALADSTSVALAGFNTQNAKLSIGSDFEGAEGYYTGFMDELLFLSRALTAKEVEREFKRAEQKPAGSGANAATPEAILESPEKFLSAHWPLDEGRGETVKNKSDAARVGILSKGADAHWQEGFLSQVLSFDGESDRVRVDSHPAIDPQGSFSLVCWINPHKFGERTKILFKGNPANPYQFYTLGEDGGQLYGGIGNGKEISITPKTLKLQKDSWQQVGLVFDQSRKKIFLLWNGGVVETANAVDKVSSSGAPLVIGGEMEDPKRFFCGEIADVRVYSGPLPASWFSKNYQEKSKEIERLEKQRKVSEKSRAELKSALRELQDLDQLLGVESVVDDVRGKESETLSKVKELIQTRLKALDTRKNAELSKLKETFASVTRKKTELNALLKKLNQPEYAENIPAPSDSLSVQEIGKVSTTLQRLQVEIDLAFRQKTKESQLKEDLQQKKEGRVREQIESHLAKLNALNEEMDLPRVSSDAQKLNANADAYFKELTSQIASLEKQKEAAVGDLKTKIRGSRSDLNALIGKLDELALLLKLPKTEAPDLSAPLTTDLKSLAKMSSEASRALLRAGEKLSEYQEVEKKELEARKKELREARSRMSEKWERLRVLEQKSGGSQSEPLRVPELQTEWGSLRPLLDALDRLKKQESAIDTALQQAEGLASEKQEKLQSETLSGLKSNFKKLRGQLLLLNSELNISETWELPEEQGSGSRIQPQFYFTFDQREPKNQKDALAGEVALSLTDFDADSFVPGKYGSALEFNGVSNYVTFPSKYFGKSQSFTVSFWFFVNRFWSERTLFLVKDDDGVPFVEVRFEEDQLLCFAGNRPSTMKAVNEKTALPLKTWCHLVVLHDAEKKQVSFYWNGKILGTAALILPAGPKNLILGSFDGKKQNFYGQIDDLQIYHSALSGKDAEGTTTPWKRSAGTKALNDLSAYLQQQVSEMTQLVSKRETEVRRLREREEEQRKVVLEKLGQTVARLNEALRTLGLPEYPDQKPKRGQESALLQKFEAELKDRLGQAQSKQELEKKRDGEARVQWEDVQRQLQDAHQKLGLPFAPDPFSLDTFEKDLARQKEALSRKRLELEQKEQGRREQDKAALEKQHAASVLKLSSLAQTLRQTEEQIKAANQKLSLETKPFDPLPWEKNTGGVEMEAYYQFTQVEPLCPSDSARGGVLELRGKEEVECRPGRYDMAPTFDGAGRYAFLSGFQSPDAFTCMLWFKPSRFGGKRVLARFQNAVNEEESLTVFLDESALSASYFSGSSSNAKEQRVPFEASAVPGQWQHLGIVWSREGGLFGIWMNGVSLVKKKLRDFPQGLSQVFFAGTDRGNFFEGQMDEIQLYSEALDDSSLSKGGLEKREWTLDYRLKTLEDRIAAASALLKNQEKILSDRMQQVDQKDQEQKNLFRTGLEKLNALHKNLSEPEEAESDFEALDPEYRISVVNSRIRRAETRYQAILDEKVAAQKALLEQIQKERTHLNELLKQLGEAPEVDEPIASGQEEAALKVLKKRVGEKEAQYGRRLQDQKEKTAYAREELKKVDVEMAAVCAKLSFPKPPVPDLPAGQEAQVLADFRMKLSELQEQWKAKEEEKKKRFEQISGEIEKLWEQMVPLQNELGKAEQKPAYDKDNAEAVLAVLRKQFEDKKKALDSLQQKKKELFEKQSLEFEAAYQELQQVCSQLGEAASFAKEFDENTLGVKLGELKTLLKEKNRQWQLALENRKKESRKAAETLQEGMRAEVLKWSRLKEALEAAPGGSASPVLNDPLSGLISGGSILGNKPPDLLAYFKMDSLLESCSFDWEAPWVIRWKSVQLVPSESRSFARALSLDGTGSTGLWEVPASFKDASVLGFSMHVKVARVSKAQTLLSLESEGCQAVELFVANAGWNLRQDKTEGVAADAGSAQLNVWAHLVLLLDVGGARATLWLNGKRIAEQKISFSFRKGGQLRFGGDAGSRALFAGQIAEFKVLQWKGGQPSLSDEAVKKFAGVLTPEYQDNAEAVLKTAVASLQKQIAEKSEQLEKLKALKEEHRKAVLLEIEGLKKELAGYTSVAVVFSVVVGEEAAALQKLKSKVAEAKVVFEARKKEEEAKRQALIQKIAEKEKQWKSLASELSEPPVSLEQIPGRDAEYLKSLDAEISRLEQKKKQKEIAERERGQKIKIQIDDLKNQMETLYLQLKTPVAERRVPDAKLAPEEMILALTETVTVLKNEREARKLAAEAEQRKALLSKWEAQYRQYQEIVRGIGETPSELAEPAAGTELLALSQLNELLTQARNREKQRVVEYQTEFETHLSELKPLLKELGEEETGLPPFDAANAKASVAGIKSLMAEKTKALEERKKQAVEQEAKIKQTAEGLAQAIEEEKTRIRSYAKDLGLLQHQMPTALKGKGIKSLSGYYKFDDLKKKELTDEMGASQGSFIDHFSPENQVIGKYGFSVQLNGLDNFAHLDLPDDFRKSPAVSFAFWIRPSRTYGKRNLLTSMNEKNGNGFALFSEDGVIRLRQVSSSGSKDFATDTALQKNEWAHVALTLESSLDFHLYVNGKPAQESRLPQDFHKGMAGSVVLGSDFGSLVDLFSGSFDEVKLYSSALSPDQIAASMQEEDLTKVSDVDLLQEEYAVLKEESQRLLAEVKVNIEKVEGERLRKVRLLNDLKQEISDIHSQMGLSAFSFSYDPGTEDKAILDLKRVKSEKQAELKDFQKNREAQVKVFQEEASRLQQQVQALQQKLKIEKPFEIHLSTGVEKETLNQARQYLQGLQNDYEIQQQTQAKEERLELRKKIYATADALNQALEYLGEPLRGTPEIKEGMEASEWQSLNAELNEKQKQVEEKKRKTQTEADFKREKEEREKLRLQYKGVASEIESLQKELNFEEVDLPDKKEDPSARIYLNFDDGKGRLAKDGTSYGNRAMFLDYSVEWAQAAIYNSCVNLNGSEGTMVVNSNPSLDGVENFSAMIWVHPTRLHDVRNLLWVGSPEVPRLFLQVHDDKLILGIGEKVRVDTGTTLQKEMWQHVALTFDKTTSLFRVFLNGALTSEVEQSLPGNSAFTNSSLYIGSNGKADFFAGFLDEFKLFSRALSPEEIVENKKEGIPQVDTVLDTLTLDQIRERLKVLEDKILSLREKKDQKNQKEKAREKQLLEEDQVIREARRKITLKWIENYVRGINGITKAQKQPEESVPTVEAGQEEAVLENLKERYKTLAHQYSKIGVKAEWEALGDASPENSVFCRISFDDSDGARFPDASGAGQDGEWISPVGKSTVGEGVSGKAVRLGEAGFLRVQDLAKVPYQLKQSVQLWIRPNAGAVKHALLLSRGNLRLEIQNGTLVVEIGNEKLDFQALGTVPVETWSLLSLNVDEFSSQVMLAVGFGEPILQTYSTALQNPTSAFSIGGAEGEANRFNGWVDELRVYHRNLTRADFLIPIIANVKMEGGFTPDSLRTVFLKIDADNAAWMRVYQDEKISESFWESYSAFKVLQVVKPQKSATHVVVWAEFKSRHSDTVKQVRLEIPIPALTETMFSLPPESATLTARS